MANEVDKKTGLQRRHFLLTLGSGGVAAAAAVATTAGKGAPQATTLVEAAAAPARDGGISEHMRRYYRSARI